MRPNLERALSHIFWLGGSSCAGKSSVARLLAEEFRLTTYHCDDHYEAHAKRIDPSRHPNFFRIKDLSPEELLMRPLDVQVAELSGFYDEEFDMVVEDLLSLSPLGPVLVEGAGLAPRRVVELLGRPRQALWLVTSAEFRRQVYPCRGRFVGELLAQCSDPGLAFENWMSRDEERARLLKEDLTALNLPNMEVDGTRSVIETADFVKRHFGFGSGNPVSPTAAV